MNLKNKNIAEGMRLTNGKDKLKVISWDKSYSDCLLNYLDSKGNRYVVAQDYELSGTEKDPQISWMNGRYFTANSDDEALEEYLDYLGEVNEYDISESLKKKYIKKSNKSKTKEEKPVKKQKVFKITPLVDPFNSIVENAPHYKKLFIADIDVFNRMNDFSFFDLVIIDDAHLSTSNKYSNIYKASQVVIFGDASFQSSATNSLMQRNKNFTCIPLHKRYIEMK